VGRDIEREIAPLAEDQHLAILPWSPLAGGLLSGKYEIEDGGDDPAAAAAATLALAKGLDRTAAAPLPAKGLSGPQEGRRISFDFPPVDRPRARVVLAALREVAAATDLSVARIALAWMLTKPFVTSVIIGARTKEQLLDNLEASNVTLDAEHVAKLDAASALPSEYPGWMLDWQDRDRRPANLR
jgi:aryl-alcohol dehydrogenase-like predicted oxidoreductase